MAMDPILWVSLGGGLVCAFAVWAIGRQRGWWSCCTDDRQWRVSELPELRGRGVRRHTLTSQASIDTPLMSDPFNNAPAAAIVRRDVSLKRDTIVRSDPGAVRAHMWLRTSNDYELRASMPSIGARERQGKTFCLVSRVESKGEDRRGVSGPFRRRKKEKIVMAYVPKDAACELQLYQSSAFSDLITSTHHPFILPAFAVEFLQDQAAALVFRPFCKAGSLRDHLFRANPRDAFIVKYGQERRARPVSDDAQLRLWARQILEAMAFLEAKKWPLTHLHSGNVIIDAEGCCRISELENVLLSVHPQHATILQTQAPRVPYAVTVFGILLWEMAGGSTTGLADQLATAASICGVEDALQHDIIGESELKGEGETSDAIDSSNNLPTSLELPTGCSTDIHRVLEMIFASKSSGATDLRGDLSLQALLAMPVFASVDISSSLGGNQKVSAKYSAAMKSLLKASSRAAAAALQPASNVDGEATGALGKQTATEGAAGGAGTPRRQGRTKKRRSSVQLQPQAQLPSATTTSRASSESGPQAAGAAPPPAPITPQASSSASLVSHPTSQPATQGGESDQPPPATSGRGALLESIQNFGNGSLRKTTTVDKSGVVNAGSIR